MAKCDYCFETIPYGEEYKLYHKGKLLYKVCTTWCLKLMGL